MPPQTTNATPNLIQRRMWVILPAVVVMAIMFAPIPIPKTAPVERHIRIEASMFQFSPSEIQVNPGDRVAIDLVSTDVVHGLSIDEYNFTLSADPGQTATGVFIADKPGIYRFRCSVACGNLHPFMIGKLRVGPDLLLIRGIAAVGVAAAGGLFSLTRLPATAER